MECVKHKIWNPDTGKCVDIHSEIGKKVIKKYGNNPKIQWWPI